MRAAVRALLLVMMSTACGGKSVRGDPVPSSGTPEGPAAGRDNPGVDAGDPPRCITADCVVAAGVGPFHVCFVTGNDQVRCWGANDSGQLGRGEVSDAQPTPEPVRGDAVGSVVALALGGGHTCGLRDDRTVVCWGANDRGQLGRGAVSELELVPAPAVGLTDVVELVTGWDHTCARHFDGRVSCWGDNDYHGQLGRGELDTPGPTPEIVAGVEGATQLAAGRFHTCVLNAAGDVQCWGRPVYDSVAWPVDDLQGALSLGGGFGVTCAVRSDRTVVCKSESSWSIEGANDAVEVDYAHFMGCVRDLRGSVGCFGQNGFGALGIGSVGGTERALRAVTLPAPAESVASTNSRTCARLRDESLWCWGSNWPSVSGGREDHTSPFRVTW